MWWRCSHSCLGRGPGAEAVPQALLGRTGITAAAGPQDSPWPSWRRNVFSFHGGFIHKARVTHSQPHPPAVCMSTTHSSEGQPGIHVAHPLPLILPTQVQLLPSGRLMSNATVFSPPRKGVARKPGCLCLGDGVPAPLRPTPSGFLVSETTERDSGVWPSGCRGPSPQELFS